MALRRWLCSHFLQGDIGTPGVAGPKGEKVIYHRNFAQESMVSLFLLCFPSLKKSFTHCRMLWKCLHFQGSVGPKGAAGLTGIKGQKGESV